MDFQSLIHSCRSIRSSYSRPFHGLPDSINFSKDGKQALFLSGGSLYTALIPPLALEDAEDVERDSASQDKMAVEPSFLPPSLVDSNKPSWKKLCSSEPSRPLSRSEQLLRERMRATGSGITSYEYLSAPDLVVVHGTQCLVVERTSEVCVSEFPPVSGAVDHKLCPQAPHLMGCVYQGEVWVLDSATGNKHRMTFATEESGGQRSAGAPSFIVQEEFDRYTGYWWQPKTKEGDAVYRILYEEIDESGVEVVHTFNPSNQVVENYKYPRPGSTNAPSKLRLLEFTLDQERQVQSTVKSLPKSFAEYFPDTCEYLVQAGWSPDGTYMWFQLVDRVQKRLRLVFVQWEAFVSEPVNEATPTGLEPFVVWEDTNEHWINMADILTFVPSTDGSIQLITSSERSGFRHLYLVKATPPAQPSSVTMVTSVDVQLTCGDWVVFGSKIWLDDDRQLVYFEGNPGSPLEKHLCVVSYSVEEPVATPTQLTASGSYHSIDAVDTKNNLFVSTHSNAKSSPTVTVFSINHTPLSAVSLHTLKDGAPLPPGYTPPTSFQAPSSTGEPLHGVVYPPVGLEEGKQYPTVLYVYGGPQIQMVTGGLSRHLPRIEVWCNHGYAVVVIDNRGSANRGMQFGVHLKEQFGHIEVEDQVTGLKQAAETVGYIDLKRVAITGWSYGGYLSLMAIALQPDVFKLAISGAPVSDWMTYDTGYTERYLGIPPASRPAYEKSSVLTYANRFPSEPNRLLIVHGMNDENVLFTHTSLLCDRLVTLGKPYQLQLYTGERHGLRSHSATLHCDSTVLAFLKSYL